MVRLRGFDEIAQYKGHGGIFATLTCPSAFHATHRHGEPNARYQNFTVRDAQDWLTRMWARARAKLHALKILFYGFRIAEPHHDGTPHWHVCLFVAPHHVEVVKQVLRGHWLSEYGDEPGARQHRAEFQDVNRAKGSAAGYLAKYIAKNIDGFEVGQDTEGGGDAIEKSERVRAWASLHGIRQFQQIGGPAVTVWRELRRLRSVVSVGVIEGARSAADSGEWREFVEAQGGIEVGRKGHVRLWTEITGELNKYDEMRGPQIVGVMSLEHAIETRTKVWRIERKKYTGGAVSVLNPQGTEETGEDRPAAPFFSGSLPSLGPVSITVGPEKSGPARNVNAGQRAGVGWLN